MRRILASLLASILLTACATVPPPEAPANAGAPTAENTAKPAPLADLVSAVDIPYERFELDNGLVALVHTDRKAPIVGVTVYYRVGSKHEPRGRTGFAHLYEHLFFGGSANAPDFDDMLESAGSTATNGSTWYDRTNYVETVPTGALDLALFLEADRMGNLLPAVTQAKLDKQRSVVQNEKRQGDNQPYGLMGYASGEGLLPVGHPYRHSTIGSMADLDAATLGDVRKWFGDNYGPNNVVLALTGDIDAATARPLVEKWFGAIPRGPDVPAVQAGPVTLPAPNRREMVDQVPVTRLTRNWTGPGLNHPDAPALEIGLRVLGGLAGSRLDNELVRGQQLAVAVTAYAQTFEQLAFLEATMDVKPGVERAEAEAAFDKVIADFIASGPSEDEVRRAVTSTLSAHIGQLEEVGGFGGKGATLAEGELYSGDPLKFRRDLASMASLTPADVTAAMQRWLTRPVFALDVVPGERTESGDGMGGWGDEGTAPAAPPDRRKPIPPVKPTKVIPPPPVEITGKLDFPAIERAALSNGIPVALTRRTSVPKVVVSLSFDAGIAADANDRPGTQALMLDMLDDGTVSLDASAIAAAQERLGAQIYTGASLDTSSVTMSALSANLAPSLALMADIARNPAFSESEVARVREQRMAELAQTIASPRALASRELGRLLFGTHPYAQPDDGLGNAESLAGLTTADLRKAHTEWLRPDLARITVVGDTTMDRLLPMLERAFGNWRAPPGPASSKRLDTAIPAPAARIVVIDRPNSPQSVIVAGRVLPLTGKNNGMESLDLANEVLGAGFLSRLNLDLREEKGWSYGVRSGIDRPAGPRTLSIVAPVQADRTGDSIRAILAQMRAFAGTRPVTDEEHARVTVGNVRSLPNRFETNSDVLGAVLANDLLGRTEDYYETLADRWLAVDNAAIDAAAKQYLAPEGLTFVIVGDRAAIEPQLAGIDIPVEYAAAPAPQ